MIVYILLLAFPTPHFLVVKVIMPILLFYNKDCNVIYFCRQRPYLWDFMLSRWRVWRWQPSVI